MVFQIMDMGYDVQSSIIGQIQSDNWTGSVW